MGLISKIKNFIYDMTSNDLGKIRDSPVNYADVSYRLAYTESDFKYITNNIENLIGYSLKELRFTDFFSLIEIVKIENQKMKNIRDFKSFKRSREAYIEKKWNAEYLIRTKSNGKRWIKDISYPWYDTERNIIGVIGTFKEGSYLLSNEVLNLGENEDNKLSFTDSLTGIGNKEYFFKRLDQELITGKNLTKGLSMLLIEIDQFREMNEQYDRKIINIILIKISEIIKFCLKETDFIARINDTEFAVCLPLTSEEAGYWVAERICRSIENAQFYIDKENFVKCTVSIGISSINDNLNSKIGQLFKIADTRLYIAKNTGKNQVSVDEIIPKHQQIH